MAKKKKTIKAPKLKATKATKATKPAKAAKPAKKAVVKKDKVVPKKAPVPKKVAVAKKVAAPKAAKKILKKVPSDLSSKKTAKPLKPAKIANIAKAQKSEEKVEKKKALKTTAPVGVKAEKKNKPADMVAVVEAPPVIEKPVVRDVFLTDAEGRRLCKVKDCDQLSVVEFYCRYHYLLFWKKIQNRKKILSEGKLEQYIEELTSRYPIKFLELIRKDLNTEADFMSAIQELDIDENSALDDFEEDENFIDEVRGISAEAVDRSDDEF